MQLWFGLVAASVLRSLSQLRDGYDAGESDALEFDEFVHHYKRATQKRWSFCIGSGGHVETAARAFDWLREQGDLPDWCGSR